MVTQPHRFSPLSAVFPWLSPEALLGVPSSLLDLWPTCMPRSRLEPTCCWSTRGGSCWSCCTPLQWLSARRPLLSLTRCEWGDWCTWSGGLWRSRWRNQTLHRVSSCPRTRGLRVGWSWRRGWTLQTRWVAAGTRWKHWGCCRKTVSRCCRPRLASPSWWRWHSKTRKHSPRLQKRLQTMTGTQQGLPGPHQAKIHLANINK